MDDLIKRLESASEGSRELDAAVYNACPEPGRVAVRLPIEQWDGRFDDGWRTKWDGREDKYPDRLKHYTTSLADAKTLLPSWLSVLLRFNEGSRHKPGALIWSHDDPDGAPARFRPPRIYAATPELVICSAALRARGQSK